MSDDGLEPTADEQYPAEPYPGVRPGFSHTHLDRTVLPLRADAGAHAGWRLAGSGEDLDDWLSAVDAAPMSARVPVLAYGSNACPGKMTWLRDNLGLAGPVVALRALCTDVAAVWASGLRKWGTGRPATLAAMPGVAEHHVVWLADQEQVAVLDVCEGRGSRYDLVRLHSGRVVGEDGTVWERPLVYTSAAPTRYPLLVDGRPVRCVDIPHADAGRLHGEPAKQDGLHVSVVDGSPVADDHPDRLFVYGTLCPDAPQWSLVEPMVAERPRPARVRGTLYDTGLGYPALLPGDDGVPGWLLRLRAPAAALPTLDDYEGEEYRRVRMSTTDGDACWTYLWDRPVDGMTICPAGKSGGMLRR